MASQAGKVARREDGTAAEFTVQQTRESRSGDAMMATRRLPKLVAVIM